MAPPGCAEYYKQAVAQIDDLIVVLLVRGKMTKQQRNGVGALIVVECTLEMRCRHCSSRTIPMDPNIHAMPIAMATNMYKRFCVSVSFASRASRATWAAPLPSPVVIFSIFPISIISIGVSSPSAADGAADGSTLITIAIREGNSKTSCDGPRLFQLRYTWAQRIDLEREETLLRALATR